MGYGVCGLWYVVCGVCCVMCCCCESGKLTTVDPGILASFDPLSSSQISHVHTPRASSSPRGHVYLVGSCVRKEYSYKNSIRSHPSAPSTV